MNRCKARSLLVAFATLFINVALATSTHAAHYSHLVLLDPNILKSYRLVAVCRIKNDRISFGALKNNRFVSGSKMLRSTSSFKRIKLKKIIKRGTIQCNQLFIRTESTPLPTPTIPAPLIPSLTPTTTPSPTPTEDFDVTCSDPDSRAPDLANELEEGLIIKEPWRYNISPPKITGTPTPTPTPATPDPPAGFSLLTENSNQILKFTGSVQTERLEGYMHMLLDSSKLKNGTSYAISYSHKIANVHCYNSLQYENHLANNYTSDTKGIYCGYPMAYLVIKRNGVLWGDYIKLTTQPRWDGGYTWSESRPWANEKIIFRLPNSGQITLELRLEMKGFHGEFFLDHLSLSELLNTFEPQLSAGEFAPTSSSLQFRDVRISQASPKCKKLKLQSESSSELSVDTALLRIKARVGAEQDSLSVERQERIITSIAFPRGTLENLQITSKPKEYDVLGTVYLSNSSIALKVGADGTVIGRIKRSADPLSIVVSGSPQNIADTACPDCYEHFYFNQEAGTIFEANLEHSEGFFFSPVFPPQDVSSLKAAAYSSAIPAPTPSGPTFSDRYGDWRFNEEYLSSVIERKTSGIIYAPANWSISPQGPKKPSAQWRIAYRLNAGDQFILSAYPIRTQDQFSACSERFQSSLSIDPKAPESSTNYQTRFFEAAQSPPNRLTTVFLNWTKYSRSHNLNVPKFYFVEFYVDASTAKRTLKYIAPNEALPECPSSSTWLGQCKRRYENGADIHGPYTVSNAIRADGIREEDSVRNFLIRANSIYDQTPVFYIGLQFLYTRNPSEIAANLKEIWDQYKDSGLRGFYFDGMIPAEPLKTIEVLRAARETVGEKGVLILHYSKDDTFLPQSDHYIFPAVMAYVNVRLLGEGVKKAWDINVDEVNAGTCPKVWGLMYGGVGTATSALVPELRGVDFWIPRDSTTNGNIRFVNESVPPDLQTRAQIQCGGLVFAPIHNEPLSATSARSSFAFIEKSRPEINSTGYPTQTIACMPTNTSVNACPNNGAPGYWALLDNACKP